MTSTLDIVGLTKRFGVTVAADALNHRFRPGACTAVLGPSGSGKTTILGMIAGLVQPDAGQVLLDGVDLTAQPAERRGFGVVFQHYALFPHLRVWENVAFGLRVRGVPVAERRKQALVALDRLRVPHLAERDVRQLSGGEQQRVAVARALALQPPILLLDEPLSAIDAQLRDELRSELRVLIRELGLTAVLVTHDQDEAMTLGDELVVLRSGRIVQTGTPEAVYARPRDAFVARFVGSANLLPGSGAGNKVSCALGDITVSQAPPTGACCVLLRPEDLLVVALGASACSGTCASVIHLGDRLRLRVRCSDTTLIVDTPADHAVQIGETVHLAPKPGRGWALPPEPAPRPVEQRL